MIRKKGNVPADYFDFMVVDECHRDGANDESNRRGILDYFAPAVQLGLTATPKRKDNAADLLGGVESIKTVFAAFQKALYGVRVA